MINIIDITHRPIQHIGKMAGVCYGSNIKNESKNYDRGIDCITSNHNRTFEYVDVTMEIDGYSNRVIRELYTHIIGVTRLQESTRYVDMSKRFMEYYTPKSIQDNPEALEAYNDTMWVIQDAYEYLIEHGVPKEDAGNLVPFGQHTKIVLKINLEALFHMFATRTCTRALPEFRELMAEMRNALSVIDDEWEELCENFFVTKCAKLGYCPESRSCGRFPRLYDDKPINKLMPTITSTPLFPPTDFNTAWGELNLTGVDKMKDKITSNIIPNNSSPMVAMQSVPTVTTKTVKASTIPSGNTFPTYVSTTEGISQSSYAITDDIADKINNKIDEGYFDKSSFLSSGYYDDIFDGLSNALKNTKTGLNE